MTNDSQSFNPFIEQSAGPYFVGREIQLVQFERSLKGLEAQQPGHLFVAGLHGTGKTSYLKKLVEISRERGIVAVFTTLDPATAARQQIATVMRAVVVAVEKRVRESDPNNDVALVADWDKGEASQYFRVPRSPDRLQGDDMRDDFDFLQEMMSKASPREVLLCIDEGQRIHPFGLSAIKNALQSINSYLVVLSLRLAEQIVSAVDDGRQTLDTKAQEAEGDTGASRFYVSGVPLGPFATDQEARSCLLRRLENNVISFAPDVLANISRITDRVPATLIALAREVYDQTADSNSLLATKDDLDRSFKKHYPGPYTEALGLIGGMSEGESSALRALLAFDKPATAVELATQMYHGAPPAACSALAEGIEKALDRVCLSLFCVRKDNAFKVPDAVRGYALELALAVQ